MGNERKTLASEGRCHCGFWPCAEHQIDDISEHQVEELASEKSPAKEGLRYTPKLTAEQQEIWVAMRRRMEALSDDTVPILWSPKEKAVFMQMGEIIADACERDPAFAAIFMEDAKRYFEGEAA